MHFSAALVPLLAIASSLVEAAPVESTTSRSPRLPFASVQASLASSSSAAAAAAAAASSSTKQVWYLAPTSTTTSQRPSRSTFAERQSAISASVSSSLAAASSASIASAIAAVPTGRLFPTAAPTKALTYASVQAFVWTGSVEDTSEGANLVKQYPGYSCASDDQLLIEARAKGRTIIVPQSYRTDVTGRWGPGPIPHAPCGEQFYLRNPLNPSQGAYFAADGILRSSGGVEDHAVVISRQAMAEVFGADFKEGQQLELAVTRSIYDLTKDAWLSAQSSFMATATPSATKAA